MHVTTGTADAALTTETCLETLWCKLYLLVPLQ